MPSTKHNAPDSKIIALHCNGLTYTQIGQELNISRQLASRVIKKYVENNPSITNSDALYAAVKMEITQENALSDLFDQGEEYTKNYKRCMENGDEKGAYAWAIARRDLLDKKLKVTGLYNEKVTKNEPVTIEFVNL